MAEGTHSSVTTLRNHRYTESDSSITANNAQVLKHASRLPINDSPAGADAPPARTREIASHVSPRAPTGPDWFEMSPRLALLLGVGTNLIDQVAEAAPTANGTAS
jgi:hypothetical protein